MVVLFAGSVYAVVVSTFPRLPEEYTSLPPGALLPMSIQYAVALESALQVNVTVVPLSGVPGTGDVIAASPPVAASAVYVYALPDHAPLISEYSVT